MALSDNKYSSGRRGILNWCIAMIAAIAFAYLLAAACAFVVLELLPDAFRKMEDRTASVLKLLASLFVLWGGRCVYLIVRGSSFGR